MSLEEAIEIYQEHVKHIILNSKDGDNLVKALQVISMFIEQKKINKIDDDIWINTKVDLLIAVNNGETRVYQKGNMIEHIEKIKFESSKEEVASLEIKQQII